MKLLFDANLSPRLTSLLQDQFPESRHVWELGLGPDDEAIWHHARGNDFLIVSKDSDFYRFSMLRGAPPKVAWLRVGNAGTAAIAECLRANRGIIEAFSMDETETFLVLGKPI